jgi:nicotinamide mononucleotide transporter
MDIINGFTSFFSVDNIAFTALDYPISWIELLGTIFNLVCVILAAKKNILTWPIGLIGVSLFASMFHQYQLYADFTLNAFFYTTTGVIGWIFWVKNKQNGSLEITETRALKINQLALLGGILLVGIIGVSIFYMNSNTLLPSIYPEPTSYPIWDSIVMVLSIAAQLLMMSRFKENWLLWIVVDIVATTLYWVKDIKLLAIEYFVFLINAIFGYWQWAKSQNKDSEVL